LALGVLPAVGQVRAGDPAQIPPQTSFELPSERTAAALCVIGTAAAVASIYTHNGYVILAGLTLGPSLGFFYGGCWGRGMLTAGLRLGATVALVYAAMSNDSLAPALAYGWLGGMAASAIVDMATVGQAVRRHNQARLARRGFNVDMTPVAVPKGAGVQLRLSF
jgi:hypothetical protein